MKLFTIAMFDEYKDIIDKYHSSLERNTYKGITFYISEKFILLEIGIGKSSVCYKLSTFLEKYSDFYCISQVINIGFAGAYGYNLYDIICIDCARFSDFDLTLMNYELGQMPGSPTYFYTRPISTKMCNYLFSADHFQLTKLSVAHDNNINKYLCDMEGAAILYVMLNYPNINVSVYKIVSDIIDMNNQFDVYETSEKKEGSRIILQLFDELYVK